MKIYKILLVITLFGANMQADLLQTLTLTTSKTSLNKNSTTTYTLTAGYSDGTTKPATEGIEWIVTPSDAIEIVKDTIRAKDDTNVTLQAKAGNALSNKIELNIYWKVGEHRLPPKPDKTLNDSTLLGIDTNHNGVRDDVERWIYEKYKDKHPIHIDIAMQAARGYKLVLEHPERAKEIHDEVRRARHCEFYYKYSAKYFNEPILLEQGFETKYLRKKIYFNNNARTERYIKYDTLLSGDSYTLPSFEEEKKACDFNISKYDKE